MKKLVLTLALAVAALPAMAYGNSNIKVSLWDRIAAAAPNNNIDEIIGLDLGIGSTAEHVSGVQFDFIYANTKNDFDGVQWAWILAVTPEFKGWQAALVSLADQFTGLQSGFINYNKQDFTGVQWGLGNATDSFTGVQLGVVNYARSVNGLQFGLINYTEDIHGLQIGLANIARNGWFPAMILVNGRF